MTDTQLIDFAQLECSKDAAIQQVDGILEAIEFLRQFDPVTTSQLEVEMIIMHAGLLIDDRNEFENNANIPRGKMGTFIDMISIMVDSDITSWCKKFYDQGFFRYGNRRITNVIFNWINGSFDNPVSIY